MDREDQQSKGRTAAPRATVDGGGWGAGALTDLELLIDEIVQQTATLIARLATVDGARAPLNHVSDLLFFTMATELESQGISRKVVADMFGLALRSYQYKVRRVERACAHHAPSLWEEVLDYLNNCGPVSRAKVLSRFANRDERVVRSVIRDLIDSGLVSTSRRGRSATLRLTDSAPVAEASAANDPPDPRPRPATGDETAKPTPGPQNSTNGDRSPTLPLDEVAEHCRAVSRALVRTVEQLQVGAPPADKSGIDSHTFRIWPGHPDEHRVLELLRDLRLALSCLELDVSSSGESTPHAENGVVDVTFYMGQSVQPPERHTPSPTED